MKLRCQSVSHELTNHFGNVVHQTDGPVVIGLISSVRLGDENNIGRVEQLPMVSPKVEKLVNCPAEIVFDDRPKALEKAGSETIRARSTVRVKSKHSHLDFIKGERVIEVLQLSSR